MRIFETKQGGIISNIELRSRKYRFLYWLLFAVLMFVALISLFPPLWLFLSSFKDIKELYAIPPTLWPKTFHPEQIVAVWRKLNFGVYYWNTLMVVTGSIFCAILFNSLTGFVLAKLRPRGTGVVFILMLWTMMLPKSLSMVPLYKNLVNVPLLHANLTNTFIPLWLMAGANALFVILYKSFFQSIPDTLLEAARIDGASNLLLFRKIVIPLSKPVLISTAILQMNATWSDFFWPFLILKDDKIQTVIVKIYQMAGPQGFPKNMILVSVALAIIPPVVIFVFFQKKIVQGFNMSGIKG